MRPVLRSTLLVSLAWLAAACGGSDSPPPKYGTVQLANATSYPIDEVYMSPTTDPTWGPKRNTTPIPVSGVFSMGNVVPESYDLLAVIVATPSRYYAQALGFPVDADQTTTLTAYDGSFSGSFQVTNGATSPITELYFVPAGWGTSGFNLLSSPITLSGTYVLNGIPSAFYDYRCVHQDLSTNTGNGIQITSLATASATCL